MPRLHETIETTLPPDVAFPFVADFANAARWDPGTATSERIDDGPVAVGATYRLGVRLRGRVAPMTYRVSAWEPGRRVVLDGEGSGVRARDEITFARAAGGTRIEYAADIRLTGWMRLLQPFAGRAFARLGREAREGMQQALDEMAPTATTGA